MHVWSKLSALKWEDAWEERFHSSSNPNLVITRLRGGKSIRVEVYCHRLENAQIIQRQFGGTIRKLPQKNWAAKAACTLKPINVRGRILIAHCAENAAKLRKKHPDKSVLLIPAELAFGTGDHATTSTVLRWLVDYAKKQPRKWDLLDLGCGTGILALAGKLLGAARVEGCDYDPAAIRISKKNAAENGISGTRFFQQDITTWSPTRKFHLILANIFFDVLTLSFPTIVKAMHPGGRLVVSGILQDQADECLAAGEKSGISWLRRQRKGKWVTAEGTWPG